MECTTIKNGSECRLMTNKGCSCQGGVCSEIVDQCKGCSRSAKFSSGWYCAAYPKPKLKWKTGNCNLATHVVAIKTKSKTKINPIKASKRSVR